MKTHFLIASLVVSLAPSAFSQQLIAESISTPNANGNVLYLTYIPGYDGVALGKGNMAVDYAMALGEGSFGGVEGSNAWGYYTYAGGAYSMALGYWTGNVDSYSIALGSKNLSSASVGNPVPGWFEDSVLFELGNGEPTSYDWYRPNLSNAITTLKNGQTTLINKAWLNRDSGASATSDPSPATTDSGGNALVVDGHTVLNGKVIITVPQGDISMGIYQ